MYDCIDQSVSVLCRRTAREVHVFHLFASRPSLVPVSPLAAVSSGTDSPEIRNCCWTSWVYIDLDKWSNERTDVRYNLKQFVSGC
jgi:hypothetical protein